MYLYPICFFLLFKAISKPKTRLSLPCEASHRVGKRSWSLAKIQRPWARDVQIAIQGFFTFLPSW